MKLRLPSMKIETYSSLNFAQRRDYFIKKKPTFLQLEKALFLEADHHLAYMPEPLNPTVFLKRGEVFGRREFKGFPTNQELCHLLAIEMWKEAGAKIFTGFAMHYEKTGLWEEHSWVSVNDGRNLVEPTGRPWRHYFGMELTAKESVDFYNYYYYD